MNSLLWALVATLLFFAVYRLFLFTLKLVIAFFLLAWLFFLQAVKYATRK